jgi:hypothetical protein
MITGNLVIDPFIELSPAYKLTPFSANDLAVNRKLDAGQGAGEYFDNRFGRGRWIFTSSGRVAISSALSILKPARKDCVTIFTTSGNRYISRCVTDEIEKFCGWSREMQKNTTILLVNHEFGFPYFEMEYLKGFGLPVIEDCAWSFFPDGMQSGDRKVGDYAVFSLPKIFPVQLGGILVSTRESFMDDILPVQNTETATYLNRILPWYLKDSEGIVNKRRENYFYLRELFAGLGLKDRFETEETTVPGVFMFRTPDHWDLDGLKSFLYRQGIECSVFYGENAFFIPVHQNLEEEDMRYFYDCVRYFSEKQK